MQALSKPFKAFIRKFTSVHDAAYVSTDVLLPLLTKPSNPKFQFALFRNKFLKHWLSKGWAPARTDDGTIIFVDCGSGLTNIEIVNALVKTGGVVMPNMTWVKINAKLLY